MSNCGPGSSRCDDGIGMFVCQNHSTPQNDVFHYVFHAQPPVEREYREPVREVESEQDDGEWWS